MHDRLVSQRIDALHQCFLVHICCRPPKTVCRQCPEYKDPLAEGTTGIIKGIKTGTLVLRSFSVIGYTMLQWSC